MYMHVHDIGYNNILLSFCVLLFYFPVLRFSVEVTRNGNSSARNDPPQVGGANSAATGGGSNKGAGKVNKERPMYYFTPVDRYGDNRDMTEPLEDLGNNLKCTCMYMYMYMYFHSIYTHVVVQQKYGTVQI